MPNFPKETLRKKKNRLKKNIQGRPAEQLCVHDYICAFYFSLYLPPSFPLSLSIPRSLPLNRTTFHATCNFELYITCKFLTFILHYENLVCAS